MKRRALCWVTVLALAVTGLVAADRASAQDAPAWRPLFNGRNMDGWTRMNAGDWTVENGLLKYTGGGNGWLRTNDQYRNYSLVMLWRYTQEGSNNDSGLFLRAGLEGDPWPNGANQLNMGPGENFGTISGTQGSQRRYDLIRPNGWNSYQVTVSGGTVTLAINGEAAWEQATGMPDRPGYIGIQAENRPLEIAGMWILPRD